MKRLSIVLGLTLFCLQAVLADEVLPQQTVKNEQSYFTANLQKQPQEGRQKQGITNHFTFFTINVQINGKAVDEQRVEGEAVPVYRESTKTAVDEALGNADTAVPSGE